ncbi:hypothetical protein SBOR_3235 [Sclerotinia borealis F-4128]|uniref:Uncharacterized protein n=1 Tax=Sclerotinia borealis (strain F-4128) TaxID=1432307 RepID=W9CK96_SCLBF|nr:hypothetical protein SBOR_3235 [Sclerotinia borealis F-4128]
MSVPFEKLQLMKLLDERVFVTWVDESGTTLMLGSCLNHNKQNPKFFMTAYYDIEGHIHIHLKLEVSIKLAGKVQQMDMLLVIPPDADFASASTPHPISSIDDLSDDASVIHEAGLSRSEHVFLIQFNLTAKGFVVTKNRTSSIIRLNTTTAKKLIRNLESLSNTTIFSVYIRPSTYAEVSLKNLREQLSNTCTATDTRKINMKEMYVQQGAMLVEWSRFVYENQQRPRPAHPQPSPEAQILRSPLVLEDVPFDIEFEDSDEKRLADFNSQELSRQFNHDLIVSKMLESKFVEWIQRATRINPNVHKHKRLITKLFTLGNCVRTSNSGVFDATIHWCSALFFYDPFDSDNTLGLCETNSWLISDIAKLIEWANEIQYGAEMSPLLVNDFMKLGNTARTVALHSGYHKYGYILQKSVCIAHVLTGYVKPGTLAVRF